MHETQKQIWLDEALDLCPDTIRSEARDYLHPLLKRCNSKSRKTFWQWLRLTLAKSKETAIFLGWMQESRLPPETEPAKDGLQYSISADASVALILVADGDEHAIWKIGVEHLDWALGLYPVSLKRLPDLESRNAAEIRKLKRKVKREMPFLSPDQRTEFNRCIAELEDEDRRAYAPSPRYMLTKYRDGETVEVHRVFMNAGRNDQIVALDENFLNFGTMKVRIILEARNCPSPLPTYESEVTVPNLQIINNTEAQRDFEQSFLQVKTTPQGDISTKLKIQPNSKWQAGVEGGSVQDCGDFKPLTAEDAVPRDYIGRGDGSDRADTEALARKWRVPTPQRGSKWGE